MPVLSLSGSIESFHARAIPETLTDAEAWLFKPAAPALVLGSSQRLAAVKAGVEAATRRSGGGAVHVISERCLWVDVVVPPSDPRWSNDVRQATYWLGEAWSDALKTIGIEGVVHRGGLEPSPWGRLVCFGSIGPGEVVIDGRKAVGISQRRTRAGARFQCIAYDRWDPAEVVDLLEMSDADRARALDELADVATGVGDRLAELEAALLANLREGA